MFKKIKSGKNKSANFHGHSKNFDSEEPVCCSLQRLYDTDIQLPLLLNLLREALQTCLIRSSCRYERISRQFQSSDGGVPSSLPFSKDLFYFSLNDLTNKDSKTSRIDRPFFSLVDYPLSCPLQARLAFLQSGRA